MVTLLIFKLQLIVKPLDMWLGAVAFLRPSGNLDGTYYQMDCIWWADNRHIGTLNVGEKSKYFATEIIKDPVDVG